MSSGFLYSQDYVSVSVHQDLKLLAFGDDLGNKAGTLDVLARLKYQRPQKQLGYLIYLLEFEKANINIDFTRYGIATGYTFNNLFSNDINFEVTPTLGLGSISRKGMSSFSWSGSLGFAYKLSKKVKLSSLLQFTSRSDLKKLYNDDEIRYSFFLGIEVNLFRTN